MRLEWILLAEGFGRDARQAVTAIGINQNVQVAEALPLVTKRGVFAHIIDSEGALQDTDSVTITLEIKNPSGRIISAQTAEAVIGQAPWPDIPRGVDLVAETQLRLNDFGTYLLVVTVSHTDSSGQNRSVEGAVEFYVRAPLTASLDPLAART